MIFFPGMSSLLKFNKISVIPSFLRLNSISRGLHCRYLPILSKESSLIHSRRSYSNYNTDKIDYMKYGIYVLISGFVISGIYHLLQPKRSIENSQLKDSR